MNDKFISGKTYIPVSGKVYNQKEVENIIKVAKTGWWTEGEYAKKFSKRFAQFLNTRYVILTNSGSSANLLAVAVLTADILEGKKLQQGDEFITTALSFPTTINPGLLYGLKPVFVDINPKTLNIDTKCLEKAISKKTKLIMVAHTLGIPFDLDQILKIKQKYNLWLVEDCCDALGSRWNKKMLGTFGDLATFSFYPAHHITMAEGGAVVTNNSLLYKLLKQFRDWGRDCWCETGHDNTCGNRFGWKTGELPLGYDHKYIYSQIGYNLKLTDFQASIGLAQLSKLPSFINKRKSNYRKLFQIFSKYQKYFLLPDHEKPADPSWFGFPFIIKKEAPFYRHELTQYLEKNHIGTRPIFAGNILKHPGYKNISKRIIGKLNGCDAVLERGMWIGVYPGINNEQINYVDKMLNLFLLQYT